MADGYGGETRFEQEVTLCRWSCKCRNGNNPLVLRDMLATICLITV